MIAATVSTGVSILFGVIVCAGLFGFLWLLTMGEDEEWETDEEGEDWDFGPETEEDLMEDYEEGIK